MFKDKTLDFLLLLLLFFVIFNLPKKKQHRKEKSKYMYISYTYMLIYTAHIAGNTHNGRYNTIIHKHTDTSLLHTGSDRRDT